MKVKVAAVQMSMTNDSKVNLDKAEKFVRQAANDGANIILLPELFENLYFCQERNYDFYKLAETTEKNPAVNRFKEVAKELNVVIPVSFYEKYGNTFYNTVAMIDADGELLGIYRKTHIPDDHFYQEKFYFTPGDTGFQGMEYKIRLYRRRNMLGSVVSGKCKVHGSERGGYFILPDCNRLRAYT